MNQGFSFVQLVALCRFAHEEMRQHAARSVNTSLVVRNWLIGWYIVEFQQRGEDRAAYGDRVIPRLSNELKNALGRGFSSRNLEIYRKFYLASQSISQTMSEVSPRPVISPEGVRANIPQTVSALSESVNISRISAELGESFRLSWSHYVVLLTVDNADERRFYEIEATENSWSVRELERQIASSLYERLALGRDEGEVRRLSQEGHVVERAGDLIKSPLVLEFLGLEERPSYSEDQLETAIIDRLEQFLLELGKGFLFEARQKRFTFDNDHFYVDLVFYNRLLRCYVLIDLKRDKLTHQDLGQMQMYVNYFDRHVKLHDELPTVGIVLCRRKNDTLVELTLPADANILAPKYQLYLPSKEELRAQVERIQEELGDVEVE